MPLLSFGPRQAPLNRVSKHASFDGATALLIASRHIQGVDLLQSAAIIEIFRSSPIESELSPQPIDGLCQVSEVMNVVANSILNTLATVTPTDRSGATAANRFQFQLSWAICRVLDLHGATTSYALVLDLHDDVIELDDETSPSMLDFHQIKSKKDGTWSLGRLIKQEKRSKTLKPSILGKLCSHRKTFGDKVRLTSFVSNRPSKLPLTNDKKPEDVAEFSLAETTLATQNDIVSAMQVECGITLDDKQASHVRFVRTALSPEDHENQCRGRLAEFIEMHVDPNAPVNPIYKMLRSELQRRNNDERMPLSADDLTKHKMFGRSHMCQLLEFAKPSASIREILNAIDISLHSEGVPFARRQNLKAKCKQVFADRLDASNVLLRRTSQAVLACYNHWTEQQDRDETLLAGLEAVRNTIDSSLLSDFLDAYSEIDFDALYLVTCHEI